jgi:outer membrane protein assembly factor BamA
VHLQIDYGRGHPALTIRLQERPSQLLSLGLRSDNERNLQGLLEIKDINLGGTGTTLGLSVSGGSRNQKYILDYHSHRLFSTSLSFRLEGFFKVFNSFLYQDAAVTETNTWDREAVGEYQDRRYGGLTALGMQIQKIGNVFFEFSLQQVHVKDKENLPTIEEEYALSLVRIGTVVDSKNSYPFPTGGVGMDISYEFGVGGDVSYNALRAQYESFFTLGRRHTIRPALTVGFADETMPFGEQFRLGGREMMFGTREDDRRGRQLLLFNLEYRFRFPFQILFDTYFHLRYDLGTISEIPEQIKFSAFRHGVGAEISLDTPIGPGSVGAGKSFYFQQGSSGSTIQHGPVLFYFMIGYQL